jgi:hypothetical protein
MVMQVNWVHVGQYHPYGDTFRVAEIRTDEELSTNEILKAVNNGNTPSHEEYEAKPNKTAADYFRGWYFIERTSYGYKYTKQEPYTD